MKWKMYRPIKFKYFCSTIYFESLSRQIGFSIYFYDRAIQFELSILWIDAFLTIGHIE